MLFLFSPCSFTRPIINILSTQPTHPTQAAAVAQGEAIKQEGRLREEEGARAKAEGEVGLLKAKLVAAEAAAEEKGKVGGFV